jgi:hypothetical protein
VVREASSGAAAAAAALAGTAKAGQAVGGATSQAMAGQVRCGALHTFVAPVVVHHPARGIYVPPAINLRALHLSPPPPTAHTSHPCAVCVLPVCLSALPAGYVAVHPAS